MWFANPVKRLAWRWIREYLDIRDISQNWTDQHCSHCRAPFARPDATFCYQCGMPLQGDIVTEPTLLIPHEQHQTGRLLLEYLEKNHQDAGPETVKRRSILLERPRNSQLSTIVRRNGGER